MTFNWPNIPFQGTEVTAFANAYKELAEAILDDYYDDLGPFGDIGELEVPYVEKAVVKELLEQGILYASFIIQQRSGTSGPGTDFVLGNSPFDISDPNLESSVLRSLGCKWDEMEASYQNNIKCGNTEDFSDDPDQEKCCDGGVTLSEQAAISLWSAWAGSPVIGNPFVPLIADAMRQYLSCDSTPITANNLTQSQLDRLKEIAQGEINAGRGVEVTNTVAQSTRDRIGATKIFQVSFYRKTYSAHLLLGDAAVTTDANNNVLCIRDDFDFKYGVERGDDGYPGDPIVSIKSGDWTVNSDGSCRTKEEVQSDSRYGGGSHREAVLGARMGCEGSHNGGCGGRGAPVPINICF